MILPDKITTGEKYGPAMKITDPLEAREYFGVCVEHMMRHGHSRDEAEKIELANLGYYAGYYDDETRTRVEQLFGAFHPVFGVSRPTPREAFDAGLKRGRELMERK
jgi:hypothetical protein